MEEDLQVKITFNSLEIPINEVISTRTQLYVQCLRTYHHKHGDNSESYNHLCSDKYTNTDLSLSLQ